MGPEQQKTAARQAQEEMSTWGLAPEGNGPRGVEGGKVGICPAVGHHTLCKIILSKIVSAVNVTYGLITSVLQHRGVNIIKKKMFFF